MIGRGKSIAVLVLVGMLIAAGCSGSRQATEAELPASLAQAGYADFQIRMTEQVKGGLVVVGEQPGSRLGALYVADRSGTWSVVGESVAALDNAGPFAVGGGHVAAAERPLASWVYGRITDSRVARIAVALRDADSQDATIQGDTFLLVRADEPVMRYVQVTAYDANGTALATRSYEWP